MPVVTLTLLSGVSCTPQVAGTSPVVPFVPRRDATGAELVSGAMMRSLIPLGDCVLGIAEVSLPASNRVGEQQCTQLARAPGEFASDRRGAHGRRFDHRDRVAARP